MKFTKMHGLGNDYVYVNCFEEQVEDPVSLARAVSDRRRGIGSDGLILIRPSENADVRMEMYNADGSRAQMCGNGIRCVARFAVEHGLVEPSRSLLASAGGDGPEPQALACATVRAPRAVQWRTDQTGVPHRSSRGCSSGPTVRIETDAGIKLAECEISDGIFRSVRVDMGLPSLAASAVGCGTDFPVGPMSERIINYPLRICPSEPRASARADVGRVGTSHRPTGRGTAHRHVDYVVTCVSIGNPHAVVFVDDVDAVALEVVGPQIERAPQFPQRINVNFVRVDSPAHVTIRTWERGSGVTQACGTGACAACVAGVVTGRTQRKITATLPGGDLQVEWADNDHVYMTGPAVEVFTGHWDR